MHAHHQKLLIGMRTLRVINSPKRVSATKCAMRTRTRQEQASIARKRKKEKKEKESTSKKFEPMRNRSIISMKIEPLRRILV